MLPVTNTSNYVTLIVHISIAISNQQGIDSQLYVLSTVIYIFKKKCLLLITDSNLSGPRIPISLKNQFLFFKNTREGEKPIFRWRFPDLEMYHKKQQISSESKP